MALRKLLKLGTEESKPATELKTSMQDRIIGLLPEVFTDFITKEPLRDLVITPFGECFNKQTLDKHWFEQRARAKQTTCPIRTYHSLDESNLITTGAIYERLKAICNEVHDEIAIAATNETRLMSLSNFIHKKELEFKSLISEITNINRLRQAVRLDCEQADDIKFWSQDGSFTKKMLDKLSSKIKSDKLLELAGYCVIYLESGRFVISENIVALMKTAQTQFDSLSQFEEALNRELAIRRKNTFFCCTSKAESRLLNSDIASISFRNG